MARGVVFPVGGSWASEGLPAPGGPLEGLNPAVGQATNAFEVALAGLTATSMGAHGSVASDSQSR